MLNKIFVGMFLIAISMGLGKLIFWQDLNIFDQMVKALFSAAETGFTLSLGLVGVLCLWMGIMKIGEDGGAIRHMTRLVAPLFSKIFPEVPKNHPAIGSMMMNISANMLGLDNAATPAGLKAMKELQSLNPNPETATNAQIMFMVLNASGLTIIPVSILAMRAAAKSSSPAEVFLPILISTFFATLAALIYVGIKQKINLFNKVILLYVGSITTLIIILITYLNYHPDMVQPISKVGSNLILFSFIGSFIILAIKSKINIYDSFIEGAKGGFSVGLNIIPYLVAMLAAIAVFRACGAMDEVLKGIKYAFVFCGVVHTEFIDALPVAFMKPFSGSGARGLFADIIKPLANGDKGLVDTFVGKLAATFQGSTETTFYVLAVYFGSVNVKNTRYAAMGGIIADIIGVITAILVAYLFYEIK